MNTPNTLVFVSESRQSASVAPVRKDRPAPIRARHIVAKHQPRLSDGKRHPVTVRKIK
jgi:hypothetical protein